MPRLGGRHVVKPLTEQQQLELSDVKPLNPRELKNLRDEKRRQRVMMIEEMRLRTQHFRDDTHLCPVCLSPCNGFMAQSRRSALCVRLRSDSPDAYQLGYWHTLRGRLCGCGKRHEAEPV